MSRHEELRALPVAAAQRVLEDAVTAAARRASWKGSTYGPIADMYRGALRRHRPADDSDSPGCTGCDEQWPCPGVAVVMLED